LHNDFIRNYGFLLLNLLPAFVLRRRYMIHFCNYLCTTKYFMINAPAAGILVYPNPASAELNISSTDKITRVAIFNLLGQTVYTHAEDVEKVEINIANLSPGVYFIKINGEMVRKFVKE
jgi:type IX secretion system substrate protein